MIALSALSLSLAQGVEAAPPLLQPCEASDPRREQSLDAMNGVRAALSGGSLEDIHAAIDAALATPCLALAARELDRPRFDHPASARVWWAEGGEDWMRGELAPEAGRWVWLAPNPRQTLDPATHPLGPALCPPEDAACAAPTAGWRLRAEGAFEQHPHVGDFSEVEACEAEQPEDYVAWRACVDLATSHDRPLLPVGALRLQDEGWLVIRGVRRERGLRCERLSAYELASGAAVTVQRCEQTLVGFGPDGARPEPVGPTLRQGHVPVDNLRELAWMLTLKPYVNRAGRAEAVSLLTPEGAPRVRPDEEAFGFVMGRGHGGGQLEQQWRLVGGPMQASGTLWWPSYPTPIETHAAELHAVVEAGFSEGCLAAAPPSLGEDELSLALGDAERCVVEAKGRRR
ncbi:MAG: hypothetical protein H6741_14615 [Alphaproteobacteria bacterium]|nr:hypothetical protein [Alphaproteobacteria bacterium]MCB9793950.1 hypothetical protein [Alphaproteobacteria bacterium]